MYTEIYPKKHTRLSDSQTKETNGGDGPIDGQTCGWTDRGKDRRTEERHQDKTQTRRTYRLHFTAHSNMNIYYNKRALIALKRKTS